MRYFKLFMGTHPGSPRVERIHMKHRAYCLRCHSMVSKRILRADGGWCPKCCAPLGPPEDPGSFGPALRLNQSIEQEYLERSVPYDIRSPNREMPRQWDLYTGERCDFQSPIWDRPVSQLQKDLINFRLNMGMYREELARVMGVSPITIYRMEAGKSLPHRVYLRRLAILARRRGWEEVAHGMEAHAAAERPRGRHTPWGQSEVSEWARDGGDKPVDVQCGYRRKRYRGDKEDRAK
jgi:DNA-binding XRE family transcriptional regulator